MVDLACVVAHSPNVVLLDQPTRASPSGRPRRWGRSSRASRSARCDLLVIEHDIALISSISDRLVALDQGAVIATGTPAEVLDHPDVVASYLGSGSTPLARSDSPRADWRQHRDRRCDRSSPMMPGPNPPSDHRPWPARSRAWVLGPSIVVVLLVASVARVRRCRAEPSPSRTDRGLPTRRWWPTPRTPTSP